MTCEVQDATIKMSLELRFTALDGQHQGELFLIRTPPASSAVRAQLGRRPVKGLSSMDTAFVEGITLPKDNQVSSKHGVFTMRRSDSTAWIIEYKDEKSTNGTQIYESENVWREQGSFHQLKGDSADETVLLSVGMVLKAGLTALRMDWLGVEPTSIAASNAAVYAAANAISATSESDVLPGIAFDQFFAASAAADIADLPLTGSAAADAAEQSAPAAAAPRVAHRSSTSVTSAAASPALAAPNGVSATHPPSDFDLPDAEHHDCAACGTRGWLIRVGEVLSGNDEGSGGSTNLQREARAQADLLLMERVISEARAASNRLKSILSSVQSATLSDFFLDELQQQQQQQQQPSSDLAAQLSSSSFASSSSVAPASSAAASSSCLLQSDVIQEDAAPQLRKGKRKAEVELPAVVPEEPPAEEIMDDDEGDEVPQPPRTKKGKKAPPPPTVAGKGVAAIVAAPTLSAVVTAPAAAISAASAAVPSVRAAAAAAAVRDDSLRATAGAARKEKLGKGKPAASKKNASKPNSWTAEETLQFYKALRECGTDFSMIAALFPSRMRTHVKTKYAKEERDYPGLIDAALKAHLPFDTEMFMRAIGVKQKAEEEEEKAESSSSSAAAAAAAPVARKKAGAAKQTSESVADKTISSSKAGAAKQQSEPDGVEEISSGSSSSSSEENGDSSSGSGTSSSESDDGETYGGGGSSQRRGAPLSSRATRAHARIADASREEEEEEGVSDHHVPQKRKGTVSSAKVASSSSSASSSAARLPRSSAPASEKSAPRGSMTASRKGGARPASASKEDNT